MRENIINACEGRAIDVVKGQCISVIDVEGGQVVDFLRKTPMTRTNLCPPA